MPSRNARLKISSLFLILATLCASYLLPRTGLTGAPPPADPPPAPGARLWACQRPIGFPAGFEYPQPASVVEGWVSGGDQASARRHGWYLWAGLNVPAFDGSPVWRTWCTSTQAFYNGLQDARGARASQAPSVTFSNRQLSLNAKRLADGRTAGEEPINFNNPPYYPVPLAVRRKYPQCYNASKDQLVDGPNFQNNGDVMVAGVVYNDAAYSWIRGTGIYLASTLNKQVPPANQTKQMAPMPPGSIVLKPMMWPVQATGYTALPVWDDLPPSADDGRYVGFEVQKKWTRAVAVTPHPTAGIVATDVKYLYGVYSSNSTERVPLGPITYRGAKIVPVQNFYYFRYPDLDQMPPCDRAVLDASAYWAYNRAFSKDDYLAVVAMHILTKEQPDWTFQSVWWHDQPDSGDYSKDRPDIPTSKAPGPWRHYLLTSTYGFTQAPPNQNQWPVAYNPYIELAADHPIATNCMNCHHRAAWPGKLASYEAQSLGAPGALDVYSLDNPIFNGLLTVDSMWAVSDRATGPAAAKRRGR